MRPIKYTDGSNGIIRLPANIWRAFYEAALYMDYPSVQECFLDFIKRGFVLHTSTDFVEVVNCLESSHSDIDDVPF